MELCVKGGDAYALGGEDVAVLVVQPADEAL